MTKHLYSAMQSGDWHYLGLPWLCGGFQRYTRKHSDIAEVVLFFTDRVAFLTTNQQRTVTHSTNH